MKGARFPTKRMFQYHEVLQEAKVSSVMNHIGESDKNGRRVQREKKMM